MPYAQSVHLHCTLALFEHWYEVCFFFHIHFSSPKPPKHILYAYIPIPLEHTETTPHHIYNKQSWIPTKEPNTYYWPMQHKHQYTNLSRNPHLWSQRTILSPKCTYTPSFSLYISYPSQYSFQYSTHTPNTTTKLYQKHSINIPPIWHIYSLPLDISSLTPCLL